MKRHLSLLVAMTIGMTANLAVAGTFAQIAIDDAFDDWAGVPVVDSDPLDNADSIDIADIQIANDGEFLYIRNTYHSNTNPAANTFVALETDGNPATGFDIFGLGLINSDAGFQNDFDFDQRGGFNIGRLGDAAGVAGQGFALIGASAFSLALDRELAIRLDTTFLNSGGATSPLFPTDTFKVLLWTDSGAGDVSAAIDYTLAAPEPTSLLLVVSLLAGAIMRRRR